MKRPETVFVRNNGTEPHSDRYDGDDFTIEPGKSVEIFADAARLCFGFGEADKSRAIRRLGWASTSHDQSAAIARLNKFSFHMEDTGHLYAPVVTDDDTSAGNTAGASDTTDIKVPDRKLVKPLEKLAQTRQTAVAG